MRKYNFSGKNSAQSSAVAPLYITKQQKEQNVGGFLGGIGYLGEKLATGFFQSLEGISDYTLGGFAKLFGADDWAEEQFENDWFGDWYTHPDEWYNPSEGWKVAGDVAGGIGTSLPSLAAGATAAGITILSGGTAAPLAAGLASAATAGLGAAGTGTKEAYKKTGQLGGKEFAYGALSGLVEGTTEGVTNALTLGTGAVLKNITKSFGKEITQTVAKQSAVKGLLGGFLGEAFEEGLSEWVNPYIARITYDADAENATAQEIFYSALIGGLSGMVMEGVNIAADTGNSFAKGAKIANSGRDGEVLGLSRNLAAFQNENATENEAFRAVADTYKTLSESLALTGGKITTAAQKKQLGDLSRANVSAVFSPMITRSAANIYANAEAIAEALGTYGYKDADGKPMSFTAEQIREGIDPTNKKSLAGALKKNTVLRTLAVADVTGQMMMDTQKFRDATLAGKNLARRADLWRFAEEATPDEIRSVSEALGIENWETLTEDDFADKITTFLRDGGAKRYADLRAESERIFADESEAAALPTLIALEDGQTRKYKTGEDTVAIARKGEGYRIFDYGTRQTSREMSRAEVNKALADNNLRGQAISARMQEYAEKTAEIKRKTQETDTWARENTKGYAELSSPNKTMIRKVIRSAKENGISDEDIKTYSSISAHSGVDIVFSKRLAKVDGGYADAFYDPKKNRIVVNPEATRSAEKILIHELDHAIRTGIRKDGGTKLFADALFGISDEAMEKITARYKDMESDVSTDELIADEANAYFAETVFADKKVLEQLTKKVPTLKERIISFLEGAVTDYAGAPKLEGAAKRYLKEYKKMFAEFAERNAGNNAEAGAAGAARYALPEDYTPTKADKEYIAALERGDMETAQKMVDEVAKAAGYVPVSRYHQTGAKFNEFMNDHPDAALNDSDTPNGFFFKENDHDIGVGADFVKTGHGGSIQMRVYLKHNNMLYFKDRDEARVWYSNNVPGYRELLEKYDEHLSDFKKINSENNKKMFDELIALEESGQSTTEKELAIMEKYDKIMDEWIENQQKYETSLRAGMRDLLNKYFIENDSGYDGIEMADDGHRYIDMKREDVHTFIVFKNTQIKSADPVTYDDNGNVIPLSQRFKNDNADIRYALPLDEDALAAVDALLESEDIKPASVIDRFVPTADGSKRMERYSRADAMKTISKFPHIDALSDAKYKQLITAMYDGMSKTETMDAKIDFARGFAQAFITDLTDARETRSDYSEAVEIKQKLAVGLQKLTFSKEDINELMHLLGEDEARAFMKRWERKKTNVKYPIDVFLADVQTAAPEFADAIDGKAPVDALIEIDRIYTDAKERAKSKYVYPYREMTDTERAMLEDKVFKGIMTGFAAADKEITAQAMKGAAEESAYFQAKLDEQTATDREFREAQQAEFDKKAKNLNERNRETKEYYGTQTKLAKIAQKGAEVTAKEAKKQAETAKKAQANAEERAAKAEARAEKQIEAEEARADRVIEAYEKKAAKAVERAEKAEDAYREMRGGERYRAYIASRVEKLREMKKGTYSNSAFLKDDTFDKIISKLISVEWRKDFSTSGTKQAFKELLEWYDPTNEIIGTNFDADLQAQISDIAVTEKKEYSAEDLKSIDEILGYFTKFIEHFNKVYINGKWVEAKPVAEGYITKLKSGAKIKEGIFRKLRQKYFTSFGDAASVMRYFDRYQKGGFFTDIFEMMRAAAIKADTEEMRLMRDYEAFMKENPKYLAEAEKTEIEFAGVKIPKMTAISLLMTMKREQARKGFAIGGFKFIDAKGEAVKVKGFATDTEISSDTDMQALEFEKLITGRLTELEGKMTDTDRAYMKVLEKVYNEDARNLKAERDKEKYGFTNVLDDYYYPIRRANSAKSVDTAYSAELDRVSSASFNKDIVKGAAGKLFIQNADVLFRNHVKAVCQYATLSPVIEAYNKLYNMDIGGNPNDPVSVKEESENLWAGANEYFRNLIGDIQGVPRTRGEGTEILSYIRGGYAKFQLGANPKTWASQLSSAFAATSILDIDSMAKATGISGKDVDKYCAIAELRNAENTAAMAQGVMTPGKRIRTKLDKVSDVMMKPIGWVDRGVVRRLFAVCQVQVQKNGGAKIGTEANKVEAGKLLERVILETQQNSFATEKSAAMRSGNEILKTFTMFSADGMKMMGRVMDGFGEVSAIKARLKGADKATKEAAKAELAAAGKKLGRSVGAMALSSLHMALVAQFFRHLYDKEEDDDTVLAVTWDMALDFGGGMLGGLPLWRDLYTRLTDGFGVENCTLETFNALMDSTAGIVTLTTKAMQGKATPQEATRAAKNVIYSACQFGGIPVRNVTNLVGGITKRFSPEAAYTVDGWFYEKNYQNDLWRAVEDGDDRMVNMLVTLAVNDKTGSTLTEAAHTELRRLISAGYNALPREVGKTITVDGTEYAMSEEEREMVREAYATATDKLDKLFANRTYSRLTDEEKTEAIRYVYNTAYNAALTDVYGIERGNAAIIAETVGYDTAATLYIRTKGIESDKGKDGKTISGTKRKKTVAAINSMPISTEKKLFLICAKGYALADGDVKGLTAEAAKKRLLRYIVNLPGKTKNEKAMLAEMCGFAVKNGKISLKNSA